MKKKDMYTLQELYDDLEMPLSALGRKGNMSEGTVSRIRDGYPARRSTINKLLRAFSEAYGIDFSLDNVSGIQIEDKRAEKNIRIDESIARKKSEAVADSTHQESPQISIVEPKRAYIRRQDTGLPEDCILALEFGKIHGLARSTFMGHMDRGLGKELVPYSERPKPGREHEQERYLTSNQQRAVLDFWKRHDVGFSQCEREECPCHR